MVSVGRLTLLLGILLCLGAQLSCSQHWSHGWYPGGKRELNSLTASKVSEKIKLWEDRKSSYLRPQQQNVLTILVNALTREFRGKRK